MHMKSREAAIVAAGCSGPLAISPHLSYKEMTFEAARRAYSQVSIDPRKDVDSFIACEEDLVEGTSITDEYAPDQMGGAQRSVCTVTQDGINALAQAYMQIVAGIAQIAVIESHVKMSNVRNKELLYNMAMDPYIEREFLGDGLPLAALEMRRYMHTYSVSEEDIALVAVKNKGNGLTNPRATFAGAYTTDEAMNSKEIWSPLRSVYVSKPADGAVVLVLAGRDRARQLTDSPVWIEGVGWFSDTSYIALRDLEVANYARGAARMAYRMAGIENPAKWAQFAEVDDTLAHKELQHLEALGIFEPGEAAEVTKKGETARNGSFPVNLSGGSLAEGDLGDTGALLRTLEAFEIIRGGRFERGIVQSWRGLPSASGSVMVLGE
jgi:acetyl-CoA C-acetyltransferase